MPLSNLSVAQAISPHLSGNEILHFGILNSLRCWNFINIPKTIDTYSNVGGFGIDGPLSTAVGSAIATTDRINICILGDLAFFYDLNILGNYNIPNNLRVVLVNNGTGVEFRQKIITKSFGELGRINISAEAIMDINHLNYYPNLSKLWGLNIGQLIVMSHLINP